MSSWLRDRIKIYKLNRLERRLSKIADCVSKEAREKKSPEIYGEWRHTDGWELNAIDWWKECIVSDALLREADKLHLPRPQLGDSDKWNKDYPSGVYDKLLTTEAMAELRSAIRKARRENREDLESWVKIFGGILGILTGLVG